MDLFFEVLLPIILLLGFLQLMYFSYLKMNRKYGKNPGTGKSERELLNEIKALKERVATLEKIATEEKFDLKKEIEKLDAA